MTALRTKPDTGMALTHERAARDAAYALADATEWSSAGLMLRVSMIPKPSVALTFALNARADCLNDEGRRICTSVIDLIGRILAKATGAKP
jgi:hypothetical protein